MAEVFISYSRQDMSFVRNLHARLERDERDTWIDWKGIPPSAEWLAEIEQAIESADTFVFVLSPDSLASDVCTHEWRHASRYNKRIVPVIARDVVASDVPEPLAKLHWLFFRPSDDFEAAYTL